MRVHACVCPRAFVCLRELAESVLGNRSRPPLLPCSPTPVLPPSQSPLENMHCAILFDVLRNPDAAILSELTGDEWRKLRGIVIAAILGTDMLHHFKQV